MLTLPPAPLIKIACTLLSVFQASYCSLSRVTWTYQHLCCARVLSSRLQIQRAVGMLRTMASFSEFKSLGL